MRALLRSMLMSCASGTVIACTLITGSTDLHTEPLTPSEDAGRRRSNPADPPPTPGSDAAVETPDGSVVPGAFCSTQTGFNQCIDFEGGQAFLDSLSKNVTGGNISLETSNSTMLLSRLEDNTQGAAYVRIPAGTSTTHFEWSFDTRLDEAGQGSIEFAEIFFDYGAPGDCGLDATVNLGKLITTEFCEGDGAPNIVTTNIPTEIGPVQPGTGIHRWNFVLDTAARTYTVSVKRPDGSIVQTPVLTLQTQFLNAAAPEVDLGINFVPNATTPGMKIRFDNFTLKFN